jgi:hypothetical protein
MSRDAAAAARIKIPTETPQFLYSAAARLAGRPKKGSRTARSWVIASGTGEQPPEAAAKSLSWSAGSRCTRRARSRARTPLITGTAADLAAGQPSS